MSLLKIQNLKVSFFDLLTGLENKLIDDVFLEINKNEIFGLVGESGSGKTMIVLSVLNLLPPGCRITSGEILWKGKNVLKFRGDELALFRGRQIGVIFQDPFATFNPVLTIGEQIKEILMFHFKMNSKLAYLRSIELLNLVHLKMPEKVFKSYPFEISGGELQRAAIAMALAGEPELLIADEPTTAIDVINQYKILELLKKLHKDLKMSILFISHDLGVVKFLATKVAVVHQGVVVESGLVSKIFQNPEKPYTQKLISSIFDLKK